MEKAKEPKKTITDIAKELQAIQKQLEVECNKCDGTGKPRTKTGKPPKSGHGDAKCGNCKGFGNLGSRLNQMETNIVKINKEVKLIKTHLNAHINKQSVEIRVLPEGHDPKKQGYEAHPDYSTYTANQIKDLKWKNGWVDYSGKFDLDEEEEMSIVVGKAISHFETYFKDGVYHRNKRLGVFLTNATTSGKRLIEEFKTGD